MPLADFFHVRVNSPYSLSAGVTKIKELVELRRRERRADLPRRRGGGTGRPSSRRRPKRGGGSRAAGAQGHLSGAALYRIAAPRVARRGAVRDRARRPRLCP